MTILGATAKRDVKILSAKSYVQDGLIFQIDGFENGGFGVHLDGSGVPVDLVGGTTGFLACDFGADAITSYSGIKRFASYSLPIAQAFKNGNFTISFCGTQYFDSDKWRGLFVFKDHSSNSGIVQVFGYLEQFNAVVNGISVAAVPNNEKTHVVITLGDGLYSVYVNGMKMSSGQYNAITGTVVDFGLGVSQNGGSTLDTHSMLIYNRALTDAEIAKNYAVDAARFGLEG